MGPETGGLPLRFSLRGDGHRRPSARGKSYGSRLVWFSSLAVGDLNGERSPPNSHHFQPGCDTASNLPDYAKEDLATAGLPTLGDANDGRKTRR